MSEFASGGAVGPDRGVPGRASSEARRALQRWFADRPAAIAWTTEQGVISWVNASFCRLMSRPAANLVGLHLPELLIFEKDGHILRGERHPLSRSLSGAPLCGERCVLRTPSGLQEVELEGRLLSGPEGGGAVFVIFGIGDVRRADAMKDAWFEKIIHEMSNPLTIITGAVAELADGRAEPLQPNQAFFIDLVRRQAARLGKLVSSLIELSRLESESALSAKTEVDAAAVIRMATDSFRHAAQQRAVVLTAETGQMPPLLEADAKLFERLIVSLVDNALRFARTKVVVRAGPGQPSGVEVSVEDDGAGISLDKQGQLFTKFTRLECGSGAQGCTGAGLGLAICKEIVRLHRGRIWVESEPGKGSRFRVLLPDRFPNASPPAPGEAGCP